MADFCYDCTKDILGVDPTQNDFVSKQDISENELWMVLCEGCGVIVVDHEGKKVSEGVEDE
jgi:rRNA maturation endonuclease Nob1